LIKFLLDKITEHIMKRKLNELNPAELVEQGDNKRRKISSPSFQFATTKPSCRPPQIDRIEDRNEPPTAPWISCR
jgi:hypothetical protein